MTYLEKLGNVTQATQRANATYYLDKNNQRCRRGADVLQDPTLGRAGDNRTVFGHPNGTHRPAGSNHTNDGFLNWVVENAVAGPKLSLEFHALCVAATDATNTAVLPECKTSRQPSGTWKNRVEEHWKYTGIGTWSFAWGSKPKSEAVVAWNRSYSCSVITCHINQPNMSRCNFMRLPEITERALNMSVTCSSSPSRCLENGKTGIPAAGYTVCVLSNGHRQPF